MIVKSYQAPCSIMIGDSEIYQAIHVLKIEDSEIRSGNVLDYVRACPNQSSHMLPPWNIST